MAGRTPSEAVAYHEQAVKVIAGGVNSNVRLKAPLCFRSAAGSHLVDIAGNELVDYALGMGPAILGHAPPAVLDAVAKSLSAGQLYAGQTTLELELARRIQRHVPAAELIRIGITGSEMVQAALRVARAATGRPRIVKFAGHYHGWFDNVLTQELSFSGDAPTEIQAARVQSAGQVESALADTVVLPWNDLRTVEIYCEHHGRDTAAIIMEPVMCNTGVIPPSPKYLEGVRAACDRHGIVLIMDEVITGFRLGLAGAQGFFGVTGDLAVFAKALGAGFPVAALTGRQSLMSLIGSGTVNHSGTYNSNVVSVSAAIATMDVLADARSEAYANIRSAGEALMVGMRDIARDLGDNLIVQGYPSVFHTAFGDMKEIRSLDEHRRCDAARQGRFLAALLTRGIRPITRGTWFVSAAHTASDVDRTLIAVRQALDASR
jgi:glutamate-1-semialdehyde 2,1-aminomutase